MNDDNKPKTRQVPVELLSALLEQLDAVAEDARRDRVLHDETIAKVDAAAVLRNKWATQKVLGR